VITRRSDELGDMPARKSLFRMLTWRSGNFDLDSPATSAPNQSPW